MSNDEHTLFSRSSDFDGQTALIPLSGRLRGKQCAARLRADCERWTAQGFRCLIFDLSATRAIDSTLLAALLLLHQELEARGDALVLIEVPTSIRAVLRLLDLEARIPVFASRSRLLSRLPESFLIKELSYEPATGDRALLTLLALAIPLLILIVITLLLLFF